MGRCGLKVSMLAFYSKFEDFRSIYSGDEWKPGMVHFKKDGNVSMLLFLCKNIVAGFSFLMPKIRHV